MKKLKLEKMKLKIYPSLQMRHEKSSKVETQLKKGSID